MIDAMEPIWKGTSDEEVADFCFGGGLWVWEDGVCGAGG